MLNVPKGQGCGESSCQLTVLWETIQESYSHLSSENLIANFVLYKDIF